MNISLKNCLKAVKDFLVLSDFCHQYYVKSSVLSFVFAPWIITFILLSDFTLNLYVITPAKRIIFPPLHFLHMKFSQKKKKKKKKPL